MHESPFGSVSGCTLVKEGGKDAALLKLCMGQLELSLQLQLDRISTQISIMNSFLSGFSAIMQWIGVLSPVGRDGCLRFSVIPSVSFPYKKVTALALPHMVVPHFHL